MNQTFYNLPTQGGMHFFKFIYKIGQYIALNS